MKRKIILNSLSGAALFGVNIVVTFLLSPVVVRELGDRGYGIWEIFLSVFGYLSILELGVGPAFIRFVARAAAQNDRAALDNVVSSTFALLTSAGAVGLLAASVLVSFPQRLLNIDPATVPEVRLLAAVLGVNFFVQLTGTVFTAYLMGLQRHYVMNGTRILLAGLQGVVTYFALTRWPGPGLVWLSVILLAANVLQFGFFALWSLVRRPAPVLSLRKASRRTARELYAFGLKSVTLMASSRVAQGSVPIVVGWILGVNQVVFYAIPNRLISYAAGLGSALGFPLMPYFSALDGRGDADATVKSWFGATRALQFVMIGMAVGALGLGGPFIARWIGPSYAEGGAWVIRFLGAGLLSESLSPNSTRVLVSMNRHGRPASWALGIAVLGVPITILLAKMGGVAGVGLAVFITKTATELSWLHMAAGSLGLGVWEHLRRTFLRFVPAAMLLGATLALLRHAHEAADYGRLAGYALAGAVVYGVAGWLFALDAGERAEALRFLGGLRRRLAGARTS
jgi:O-antigen/teichoic acid export membrane protein